MNNAIPSNLTPIWRSPFILSDGKRLAGIRDTRPTEADRGVLDVKTFNAIETDALFDEINRAETWIGQSVLYRSLAKPTHNAQLLQKKQEALRELADNPELHAALERFVKQMVAGEESLYYLLYGEFNGGLATDDPKNKTEKLEFGGYGYHQFIDGTQFAVDLVEEADALPPVRSAYLRELIQAIVDFGNSRTYALMHGPIYVIDGKFKTSKEKPRYLPVPRFRPTMFKWLPMLIFVSIVSGLYFFFQNMWAELGETYIGYGILILTVPMIPIVLQAICSSDLKSVIYPLQKLFRKSPELAKAMESLGMIDELLSLHRYAKSVEGEMTLPEILAAGQHSLTVSNARNPLLARIQPDYVPNDIKLDAANRLLIITGPNSGGKTAYCKTIVQIQLLGQTGGYVPASHARLVPAEHIFYQVPEPGRLDEGMGRFAHELKQTREIFFNSTPLSLVILDELAEGTTFEERMTLSEYVLKGFHQLGATTILVTHNHELCERLSGEGIGSYLQVEFLPEGPTHRLIPGISHVSHADRVASALGFSKEDVEKHLATLPGKAE